jgi:hypothetical protein
MVSRRKEARPAILPYSSTQEPKGDRVAQNNNSRTILVIVIIVLLVVLAFIIGRGCERNNAEDSETTPTVTHEVIIDTPAAGEEPVSGDSVTEEEELPTELAPPQEPPAEALP